MLEAHISGTLWKSFRNSVIGGEEEEEKEGFGGSLRFPERFAQFSPQDRTQSTKVFSVAGS